METATQPHPGVTTDPDGEVWWNLSALAEALCCAPRTARRWTCRIGFPQAYRFGPGVLRWKAAEVRAWRDAQRTEQRMATASEWRPTTPAATRKAASGPRPRKVS